MMDSKQRISFALGSAIVDSELLRDDVEKLTAQLAELNATIGKRKARRRPSAKPPKEA